MSIDPPKTRRGSMPTQTMADALRQQIMGFRLTQVINVAAKLGLADELANGAQPASVLASRVGANPGALYRLLRALASVGLQSSSRPSRSHTTKYSPLSPPAPRPRCVSDQPARSVMEAFEDAIRQQLRLVPTMPATEIALSFPPIQLPDRFGQVRTPALRTVLTMVTGYSRGLSTILIPTPRAEDCPPSGGG